ncbi:dockerin type I domain-containing protein [Candidatus Poribacteria bacterium]
MTLDVTAIPTEPEVSDELIKGDVNGDRQVNSDDVRLLLQFLLWPMKSAAYHRRVADMNSDGRIRLDEVMFLLRRASIRTAPGKNRIGRDISIALDRAQSTVDDGVRDLSSSTLPKGKTATAWAASKVAK